MIKYNSKNRQRGNGSVGIAACMLGFSFIYFIIYFVLNWIYDTKEERKLGINRDKVELREITKEEVMKRGIGMHVFKCYGLFSNKCRPVELYKDTVKS